MIEYSPLGFSEHSTIGPHEGLRVTFAETRSALTPDFVEQADFRDNMAHLIDEMEHGGFALAPASDTYIAPGELSATIDFAVAGSGYISVGQAVGQLQDGLYGFLDIARRTYIKRVTKIEGREWGKDIPDDVPDKETNPWAWLAGLGTVALVVGAAIYLAPEIKLATRGALRARGAR